MIGPQLEGTNCGYNHELGFQEYAHEVIFLLLVALSNGIQQGSISISVNLDLPTSFCLMLQILLFIGIKVCPAASLQGIFSPMLINCINRICSDTFNILRLLRIYA
jgi:hypothetical protein